MLVCMRKSVVDLFACAGHGRHNLSYPNVHFCTNGLMKCARFPFPRASVVHLFAFARAICMNVSN